MVKVFQSFLAGVALALAAPAANAQALELLDRDEDGLLSKYEIAREIIFRFERRDTNEDGHISRAELSDPDSIYLVPLSDLQTNAMMKSFDLNEDGSISTWELYTRALGRQGFDLIDRNDDGKISPGEAWYRGIPLE